MPIRKRQTRVGHLDMFLVRDNRGRVIKAVRREYQAQQLLKKHKDGTVERVVNVITEAAERLGL